MKKISRLQSNLSRARGLGAAHDGVHHWWLLRLTSLALIPLGVWFIASLMIVAQFDDPFRVADWFSSPFHAGAMVLLVIATFWHAKLGLQVVIEDYVGCPWKKYALLIANNFFCIAAAVISVIAILRLHMLDLVAGT